MIGPIAERITDASQLIRSSMMYLVVRVTSHMLDFNGQVTLKRSRDNRQASRSHPPFSSKAD